MTHKTTKIKGGFGITGWMQSTCSFGSVGQKHYAHNDYQFSNYQEEMAEHLSSIKVDEFKLPPINLPVIGKAKC